MRGYRNRYNLLVNVTTDTGCIKSVPCDAYIAEDNKSPLIDLFLTIEQYKQLRGSRQILISGEQDGKFYIGSPKIQAKVLLPKAEDDVMRGSELKEIKIRFEVWDLLTTEYFHKMNASLTGVHKCKFYLTKFIWALQPHRDVDIPSYEDLTYTLTFKDLRPLTIKLQSGKDLIFRTSYRHEYGKANMTLIGELVAECSVNEKDDVFPASIEQTLEEVKDVIALASFASRDWCFCYKWTSDHEEGHTTAFIKTVPVKGQSTKRRIDALVLMNPESFVKDSYDGFATSPYKEHIKRAIYYTLPNKHLSLDARFVQLFMAIEVLGRSSVSKSKQPEHLADCIALFCKQYGIDLSDLWPMFKPRKGSLYSIRNKLMHGDILDYEHFSSLMTALWHLQWSVERMLIGILGWDVSKSTLSPTDMAKAELKNADWRKDYDFLATH